MTNIKKPTHAIVQEALADRIRFLEDELYNRAYKDIEKQEVQIDFLKGVCVDQQATIMDYEWDKLYRSAMIRKQKRKFNHR